MIALLSGQSSTLFAARSRPAQNGVGDGGLSSGLDQTNYSSTVVLIRLPVDRV